MKSFSQRLGICLRKGQMTMGDLRWWFDRSYATTASWVKDTRRPRNTARGAEAWRRLEMLEKAIAAQKGFPVPHTISLLARPRYIEKLFHDNSAAVSRKNTSRGRLQVRDGVQ
jgi:hypothetical protein